MRDAEARSGGLLLLCKLTLVDLPLFDELVFVEKTDTYQTIDK